MRLRTVMRVVAPATVCWVVGVGVGRAFAPGNNLYINGGIASHRVIEHDGAAYAPIADIAKALNMSVVPRADGYAISAGGANQVGGISGKVGDSLSSGQVTFTVVKVIRTAHYAKQFDSGDAAPSDPTKDNLVVVVCRVKNALPKEFTLSVLGGDKTALTDQNSHSYNAGRFSSDFRVAAADALPGSAVDFALGFSVPKTERIGDLVYEVSAGGGATVKPAVFRVSLGAL